MVAALSLTTRGAARPHKTTVYRDLLSLTLIGRRAHAGDPLIKNTHAGDPLIENTHAGDTLINNHV